MKVSLEHFCACMGPMYGEPYCYCTMKREGLSLNTEARELERKRAQGQLVNLSIFFETNRKLTQQGNQRVEKTSTPAGSKHD